MKKTINIFRLSIILISLFFFPACDSGNKNNDKFVKPVRSAQPVKTRINKQVEVGQKTPVEKNDNISDTIIKETADFDAALGLEFAKFNYDANNSLADYTNVIVKLNDNRFFDFVYGYLRAHKNRFPNAELALFRELIKQRFKNINALENSIISEMSTMLMFSFTPKYCGEADYTGLNQTTKEVLLNLNSVNNGDRRKNLQMSFLINAVNATGVMQKYSLLKGEMINDDIAKIIDEHLSKEQFSDAERDNLNQYKYCALVLSNPEKIQNELPDILNSWRGKKDWRYKACTVTLEAFDKGLRDKEASQYVKDKLFPNPGD